MYRVDCDPHIVLHFVIPKALPKPFLTHNANARESSTIVIPNFSNNAHANAASHPRLLPVVVLDNNAFAYGGKDEREERGELVNDGDLFDLVIVGDGALVFITGVV